MSDALVFAFILCTNVRTEVGIIHVLNQPYMHDDFDLELHEFKLKMMAQVLNVLGPLLTF